MPRQDAFATAEPLRRGTLYQCKVCHRHWHLDADGEVMTHVPEERVPLIREWSRGEILLPRLLRNKVDEIGPTPADIYGNGKLYTETPCSVLTREGHTIDVAIFSIQRSAPFESGRPSRVATDIVDIFPSPFALPLDVRVASSQADELRMGFAPTVIEMPDGHLMVLNWQPNFLIRDGYNAATATISGRRPDPFRIEDMVSAPADIVYFIADG
jgi:hypothetical protein